MFTLAPDFVPIDAPQTEAEIDAFVEAVMACPELHIHDATSSKMGEHMAALNLVPRDEITHIAIGHGDWDDPANWYDGQVPGDDARVLIPEGIHMTYDHVSDARLFTLRVDGKLEFSTEVDSQMVVDTIVISPSGALQIGTEENPVDPNVNVDIIFANNGPIDTDWDPMLLSRGMIAHGEVEIHGSAKDSHEKVAVDPEAGDDWVDMGEVPEGWAVGDTIVIAGTQYKGYINQWDASAGYVPPEDEIRVITDISDGMVFFDEPLEHDHGSPRDDLKTSVANYTRNVSFETEDADLAEVYERGHVMFMHNDDVDVRYAEFHELGRTDKSETALNVGEFETVYFDTNVKGRYAFHFHRAGLEDQDDPGISIGNAVYGSPGWGFVHHDSNAIFDNNATYDTFGAGYVAESGNETGAWTDNIAIFAQGRSWRDVKNGSDPANFDNGVTGDGFFFQSRMVASIDNVAASVNHGFAYFHRGALGEDGLIMVDSDTSDIPDAFHGQWEPDEITPDDHPILSFSGNETFASRAGLFVSKADPFQGHDVHTVLQDFTAWEVSVGAGMEYTSRYILKDFDIIGRETLPGSGNVSAGIHLGTNSFDITIVDAEIEKFKVGIELYKDLTFNRADEFHSYKIINPTLSEVWEEYTFYDPELDTILTSEEVPGLTPDLELNRTPIYSPGETLLISARKHDSLGEDGFMRGEGFTLRDHNVISELHENGYYTTSDGQDYFMTDIFFSDRATGDIYMERHPVFVDESVPLGEDPPWTVWGSVAHNGEQDLGSDGDPTIDSAVLWATLTDGQFVLSDEALAIIEEQDEEEVFYSGIGDDLIDGGNGVDTVIYSGNQASYSLILSATSTSIVDRRAGGNGTDQLVDIELLDFDTGISEGAFDLQQFAGTAGLSEEQFESFIELYIAYFNRAPDAVGLNFWGTAFANGTTLEKIATLFIDQDEIRATYPASQSNADFVTAVYNNVLGRIPDQAGFDFWVGVLDAADRGQDQFILSVLQSVQEGSPDREYLDSKIDVGAYFAVHKGMSDVSNASASMALFDGTQAGIDTAVSAIDDFYADALDPSNGEFLMQVLGVLDDPFAVL